MIKINSSDILKMPIDEAWTLQQGTYLVKFPDGEKESTSMRIKLSRYYWELFNLFPGAMPVKEDLLDLGSFNGSMHNKMMSTVFWNVERGLANRYDNVIWEMSYQIYVIANKIFNDTDIRLGAYVNTLSLKDLWEVIRHPKSIEAKTEYFENKKDLDISMGDNIERLYEKQYTLLESHDPLLIHNEFRKGVSCGTLDKRSTVQISAMRGITKDINRETFPVPLETSYGEGLPSLYDSAMESRSASNAYYNQDDPLKEAEYFNRQMQQACSVVDHIEGDDCGSTETLMIDVREQDINSIVGTYYIDENDGVLKHIPKPDKNLVGRKLQLRSFLACRNANPQTTCKTCLGTVHKIIPPRSNLGMRLINQVCAKISQGLLSTKHLEISLEALYLFIDSRLQNFITRDKKEPWRILLKPTKDKAGKKVSYKLKIPTLQVHGINNVLNSRNPYDLAPARISKVYSLELLRTTSFGKELAPITIETEVGGSGSSLTVEMLALIQRSGIQHTDDHIIVDLEHWNFKNAFILTPRKNLEMMSYLNSIKAFFGMPAAGARGAVKSTTDDIKSQKTISGAVTSLMDILSPVQPEDGPKIPRIDCNIVEVQIFIRALMTRDSTRNDFRLPVSGEDFNFTTIPNVIKNRSVGTSLAYGFHREIIQTPAAYMRQYDTMELPLDYMLGE